MPALDRAADRPIDALKLALNQAINGKAKAPAKKSKANERGDDGDARQIIADLISREESPFLPDDEQGSALHDDGDPEEDAGLVHLCLGQTTEEEEEPARRRRKRPRGGDSGTRTRTATKRKKPVGNRKKGKVMTNTERLSRCWQRSRKRTAPHCSTRRKLVDARKTELVEKITGNSAITKDQANAMDLATLEVVAAGIRPEANYSGRAMPVNAEDATDAGKAMVAPSVSDMIVNRNKKGGLSHGEQGHSRGHFASG